jgi:hypothetical protein
MVDKRVLGGGVERIKAGHRAEAFFLTGRVIPFRRREGTCRRKMELAEALGATGVV